MPYQQKIEMIEEGKHRIKGKNKKDVIEYRTNQLKQQGWFEEKFMGEQPLLKDGGFCSEPADHPFDQSIHSSRYSIYPFLQIILVQNS